MRLEMCVYISRTTELFRQMDVPALAEASAYHIRTRAITGLLLQIGNYFVQVLEGDAPTVSALLTKISHDKRHTDVRVIYKNAMPAYRCYGLYWWTTANSLGASRTARPTLGAKPG